MGLENLNLEKNSSPENEIIKINETQKELKIVSDIQKQIYGLLDSKNEEMKNFVQENPNIQNEINLFIQNAANSTLSGDTAKFNSNKFDIDSESGLDKFEFNNFKHAIDGAIKQIILLDGFDLFQDINIEANNNDFNLSNMDKFIAKKADIQEYIFGESGVSSLTTKALSLLPGLSEGELEKIAENKFNLKNPESYKQLSILLVKDLGEGAEDILKFLGNILSSIILLPRYLNYRIESNSSDPKTKTEAEIKLQILIDDNPALAICELAGEKGIQMIKSLGTMMSSGKNGDISTILTSVAGLIAGGAGAAKIISKTGKLGKTGGKFSKVMNKIGDGAEKIQFVADKVDHVIGGDKIVSIGKNTIGKTTGFVGKKINKNNLFKSSFGEAPDSIANAIAWTNIDGSIGYSKKFLQDKLGIEISSLANGETLFNGYNIKDYIKQNPENGAKLLETLKILKTHESMHRILESFGLKNGIDLKLINGQSFHFSQEAICELVDGTRKISKQGLELLEKELQTTLGENFKLLNENGEINGDAIRQFDTKNLSSGKDFSRTKEAAKIKFFEKFNFKKNKVIDKAPHIPNDISGIKNFGDLEAYLQKLPEGGIKTSNNFFSSKELISIIKRVKNGELSLAYVTKSGDLRDKVRELLKNGEKIKKINNDISGVKTFGDLEIFLQNLTEGGIKTSDNFYSSKELISIIKRVKNGELNINYVTKTGNLRDKVRELLENGEKKVQDNKINKQRQIDEDLSNGEIIKKIQKKESLLGILPDFKWTHRTDYENFKKMIFSEQIGANSTRGVNFWLGSGSGYGDIQIIMKDSVMKLPPAKEIPGNKVKNQANMHYFFGNMAEANGLNVHEFSKKYGDFRHFNMNKGNNPNINVPYLNIGGTNAKNSNFNNTVGIDHVEAIMIPKHIQNQKDFQTIKKIIEGKGIKIIDVQTPDSVLNYSKGSIVNAVGPNKLAKTGDLIIEELKKLYPNINSNETRIIKYLKDSGQISISDTRSFQEIKNDYNKIAMKNGCSRGDFAGGQYENYVSESNHTIEQQAYFKYLIESKKNAQKIGNEQIIDGISNELNGIFNESIGVWEGYSLKEHTLMVMKQFEKYFSKELPNSVNHKIFKLILALHDIGKPHAVKMGDKGLQHKYTGLLIEKISNNLGLTDKEKKLAIILTSNDVLGKLAKKQISIKKAGKIIKQMSQETNLSIKDFYKTLQILYKSDISSYTLDAGGKQALDHLLIFDKSNQTANLIPELQYIFDDLEKLL